VGKPMIGSNRTKVTNEISCNGSEHRSEIDDLPAEIVETQDILQMAERAMFKIPQDITKNEGDLLRNVCQKIVEGGGYRLAWVGYLQKDQRQTIRPVTYAGENNGYLAKLNIALQDPKRGYGPAGTAIRTGQPVVSRDIKKDDTFKPWSKDALRRGFKSTMAIPLMADNKAFGVMSIYSSQTEVFDTEEQKLLQDMVNDLAYAIILLHTHELCTQNKTP
jgi:GAF domain-containing protein